MGKWAKINRNTVHYIRKKQSLYNELENHCTNSILLWIGVGMDPNAKCNNEKSENKSKVTNSRGNTLADNTTM